MDQKPDPAVPISSDPGIPPIPEPELPDGLTPVGSSVTEKIDPPKMVTEEEKVNVPDEKKGAGITMNPEQEQRSESNVLTGLLKEDIPSPTMPDEPMQSEGKTPVVTSSPQKEDIPDKKDVMPPVLPPDEKKEEVSPQSFVVPHDGAKPPEKKDESMPPKPKKKKSGVKTGLIISAILLFITLPVAVYYVSEQRAITEQRKKAASDYDLVNLTGTIAPKQNYPAGHSCTENSQCASGSCGEISPDNTRYCSMEYPGVPTATPIPVINEGGYGLGHSCTSNTDCANNNCGPFAPDNTRYCGGTVDNPYTTPIIGGSAGGDSCVIGLNGTRVCPTKPNYNPDAPLPGVNSGYQTEGDAVWGCGEGSYHVGVNGNYYCGEDTGGDDGGGTPSSATSTPTTTPTPTATVTPTPTSIPANTSTPTPTSSTITYYCDGSCESDAMCPSGTACVNVNGILRCRNTACPSESTCVCPSTPAYTPTPTQAYTVVVTATPILAKAATSTPTPSPKLTGTPTHTPTPTLAPMPGVPTGTPTATPVPKLPVSGVGFSVMGMTVTVGAILLILLGLAL